MNDWIRLQIEEQLRRDGFTDVAAITETTVGDATLVAFEATRNGARTLCAFGVDRLDTGEYTTTGSVTLPYPVSNRTGHVVTRHSEPWLVVGGWSGQDSDRKVVVGRVQDRDATRCTATTAVSSTDLPVTDGVVIGWVPSAPHIVYAAS